MKNVFENAVARQVAILAKNGIYAMNQFFGKGILIQNGAYNARYATNKKSFTCEVLSSCGYCDCKQCHNCKLESAYMNALKEISEGKRVKEPAPCNTYNTYYNNNGHTTLVMRCDNCNISIKK